LSVTLKGAAGSGLNWKYTSLPNETHATIYHPAALEAFRYLFKPAAQ
jgi:hypothetical protein